MFHVTPSPFDPQPSLFSEPRRHYDSPVNRFARKFFGTCSAISGIAFIATGAPVALSCFCIFALLALSVGSSGQYRRIPDPLFVPAYRPPSPPQPRVVVVEQPRPPVRQERVVVLNQPDPYARHQPDSTRAARRESSVVEVPFNAFAATDLFARHEPESTRVTPPPAPRRNDRVVVLPDDAFQPTVRQVQNPGVVQVPATVFTPTDIYERHQPDSTRREPTPSSDPFARHTVGE